MLSQFQAALETLDAAALRKVLGDPKLSWCKTTVFGREVVTNGEEKDGVQFVNIDGVEGYNPEQAIEQLGKTMLDSGITAAEQRAYDEAHKDFQYDDDFRLSDIEYDKLYMEHADEWAKIMNNVSRGIITHGEADKRGLDLLAGK